MVNKLDLRKVRRAGTLRSPAHLRFTFAQGTCPCSLFCVSPGRDQLGMAAAFFAIMLVAIIGLGSMVIDVSQAYSLKTRIKNAVDLASLAGISQLINQTNTSSAKNTTLEYLNNNLTMALPDFSPLTLNSNGLSIQVGIYDFNNMTFTPSETNPAINSIRTSLTYNSMNYLGYIFMMYSSLISDTSVAVKQTAGRMPPGGGFPLALQSSLLSQARTNNYMVDLVQTGIANSFFTAFSGSNASSSDIQEIINYFQNQATGISPPSLSVGEMFQINNGTLTSVYMTLDSTYFEGMTFISPVVTVDQNFTNNVTVQGFVGFTIDDVYKVMNDYHIAATIIPNYIDNNWSGLIVGAGPGNVINPEDVSVLAASYGLVQ